MGLSTTDLSTGGSGLPKTLAPGNHLLKINSINLDDYSFIPGAKHLMMHVEGEPIDGFQGFLVDKDDESKGHYAGQIGRVKASQYAFADGETKTGIKIQANVVVEAHCLAQRHIPFQQALEELTRCCFYCWIRLLQRAQGAVFSNR